MPEKTKPQKVQSEKVADGDYAVKAKIQKGNLKKAGSEGVKEKVDLSTISGRNLSDLYVKMLGIPSGIIPSHAEINFSKVLADMWVGKLTRKKGVSEATIDNAHTPVALYQEDARKINLKQFITEAEAEVKIVKANLNWDKVCAGYKLKDKQCFTLKLVAKDIRGLDLVAYGMTELLPSSDGKLNVKYLDILLKNAGSNFVMAVPAMADSYLSLGFYQFTSLALRDDGIALEGASKASRYLPEKYRIPGSVIKLRNGENHRAAYLFVIHNLATLVKKLNEKQTATLQSVAKSKPGDIVTFMAVAHHSPSGAIKAMKSWLSSKDKTKKVHAPGHLNPHLKGRLVAYGYKTDSNLDALEYRK